MATDNEQAFKDWMRTQKHNNKNYTNNTITTYCQSLKNSVTNLKLSASIHIQPNLFLYNDWNRKELEERA